MTLRHTALYERHVDLGAKLADFGGWQMPIEYAGAVPAHLDGAQVADVPQAHPLPHRPMLLDDADTGVLDGHLPAAEVGELGAERHVSLVQGGAQQCHGLGGGGVVHTTGRY